MHKTSRREFKASEQSVDNLFFYEVPATTRSGARVYQISLDHAAGQDTSCLSEAELARVARMRSHTLQQRALASRVALRKILALETGQAPASMTITFLPNGKPVLSDHAVHFSLAHTGGHAAVVVSTQGPVGIDIESSERDADFIGITAKFFHKDEARWLGTDQRLNFFRLWTSKEAVLKCTGDGIACHLPDVRTLTLSPAGASIEYANRQWQVTFHSSSPSLLTAIVKA